MVTDAVIAIGTGVEGMHNAMSNQDEEGFLLSCLDLVSSLASLTGPYGKVLADILGMISGFIKMFQETPKVESQESMIKRYFYGGSVFPNVQECAIKDVL